MKVQEVGKFIREQRTRSSLTLRKLADLAGISDPYLSQVERGLRRPSADILQAIAKGLRISAESLYEKAGILEGSTRGDTVKAILGDSSLTLGQRESLLEIYKSFRAQTSRRRSNGTSNKSKERVR